MRQVDVVVVGGGIGGSALAGCLAKHGYDVLMLEQLVEFADRVRGEWMAPWGVAELQTLGLYERFLAAGGHHVRRGINYDELRTPEEAEAGAIDLGAFVPGIPGPLCMEHVTMQNEALAAAAESAVAVRRGVSSVRVVAGESPSVSFRHEGNDQKVGCRLVVGADGRTSLVRRQLGIPIEEAPLDHLIAGLLIGGVEGWPMDLESVGKFGDIHYLVFPQGGGKVRLYADYAYDGRPRFAGEGGAERFLAAFDIPKVPHSRALAQAQPIGPCRSFPSQDAWVDEPCVVGAVLIGDAAGYNDPILGQGLSVTLRDARSVAQVLTDGDDWSPAAFRPYMEERRERMRRLRFVASLVTTLFARFQEQDVQRRARAMKHLARNPAAGQFLAAPLAGPESIPAEYFTERFYAELFGTTEHVIF